MTRPTRNAPIGVSLPVRKREIRTRSTALRLAVCLVACWLPALVSAQTDIWKGGTGNWTDATKWNNGVPTPTSNVFIDNGNPAASAVTVDTNPAQCNNLTIDGDDSLTVGNGQALYVGGSVVNNAGTLGVTAFSGYLFFSGSSPTISNAGTISLNAVSGGTVGLNVSGTATLKGAGNLTMTNAAGNYIMGPYQPSPGASLTNQTTIRGSGGIGGIAGIGAGNTFTNQATINANQTTPLIISNSTGQTFINTGTLEATNGAIMGLAGGTITNTGGIIHADPGSTVELQSGPTDGTTITGGTLTTSGTGVIQSTCCFNNGTLNGVTNNGTFKLIQTIENLNGTVTNNGSFQVNAAGFNTDLNVTGAVILKGTGSLTMSNDANNHIMGYGQTGPGASLLNQSTIQGGGSIGWNGGLGTGNSVTNQGSIFANVVTPLTIGVSTGSFTNTGTLKVKKGSAMYITGGGFSNFSGSTLTGGTYMVSGTLGFDGANILSNAASITLTGASAQIVNDLNSANALANFATNTTTGSFSLLSGKLLNTTVT